MPADLGTLPRVAEPLVRVAPLAVMSAPAGPGIFLKPKELVVGGRPMPEGGFFPSSPLLLPASDGERWMLGLLDGALPFSDALASSVLPVSRNMFVMALIPPAQYSWPGVASFLQIISQPNQSSPVQCKATLPNTVVFKPMALFCINQQTAHIRYSKPTKCPKKVA